MLAPTTLASSLRRTVRPAAARLSQRAFATPSPEEGGKGGAPQNLANPGADRGGTSRENGQLTPQGGKPNPPTNYALIIAGSSLVAFGIFQYISGAAQAKGQLADTNLKHTGATGSTGEDDPVLTKKK